MFQFQMFVTFEMTFEIFVSALPACAERAIVYEDCPTYVRDPIELSEILIRQNGTKTSLLKLSGCNAINMNKVFDKYEQGNAINMINTNDKCER